MQKPKRSLNAYNHFFSHVRKTLLDSLPEPKSGSPRGSHGKIGFRELAREVSAQWKATSSEDKAPFEAMAEADKQRHQREMAEYKAWLREQEDKERAASALEASHGTGGTAASTIDGAANASFTSTMNAVNTGVPALAQQRDAGKDIVSVPLVNRHAVTPPPSTTRTFLDLSPQSTSDMDQVRQQLLLQLSQHVLPPRQPTVADLVAQLDPASQELLIRALMNHHAAQYTGNHQ